MPKFRVGLDWKVSGMTYVEIEAATEDEAAALGEKHGEDYVADALRNGDGRTEVECCDVLPPKAG